MLHLILTLGLTLSSPPQDGQDPVVTLEAAVESGAPTRIVRALAAAGEIEDPRVVKACFQALLVEKASVRLAAIEALRFNPHTGALQVLHSQLRKGTAVTADPALEAAVVRAIAQHGSEESVPLLATGALDASQPILGRARVLGIGHIGTRRGVNALLTLGSKLPADHRLLFVDELRLALGHATGEDHGLDLDAWASWWEGSKASFEAPDDTTEPPALCALEWKAYWTSRATLSTPAPALPMTTAAPRAARRPKAVEASAPAGAAQPAAKGQSADGEADGEAKPRGRDAANGNAKAGNKKAGPAKNGKQKPNGGKQGKNGAGAKGNGKNAAAAKGDGTKGAEAKGSGTNAAGASGKPADEAAKDEPQDNGPN